MKERRQKVDTVQQAAEAFKSSSNKNENVSCIFKENISPLTNSVS